MKLDTVTLEVIRNALPAVANEMAADLQRTSYNMMIYEVRDYCTALLNTKGELISQNVGGVSHFVADLGVLVTDGMQTIRRGRLQAGRRHHHQPPGGGRPAPQQRRHLHALLLQGRASDVPDGARALDRRRRHLDRLRRRRDRRRPLARRTAARPAQDLRGGQAQRAALPRHQGQHPLPGILARRHEIADGGLPPRRAPARRAVRQIRPRHAARGDRPDFRRDRAEMPQRGVAASRRRLRGLGLDRRRRRAQGRRGADPRQGHGQVRRHDHRPVAAARPSARPRSTRAPMPARASPTRR